MYRSFIFAAVGQSERRSRLASRCRVTWSAIGCSILLIAAFDCEPLSAVPPTQTPGSANGEAGQRQERCTPIAGLRTTGRIVTRVDSRIESRLRNRIDRGYNAQQGAVSSIQAAEETLKKPVRSREESF